MRDEGVGDESVGDEGVEKILNRFNEAKLISTYKTGKDKGLSIDGKKVYNALNGVANGEVTYDEFFSKYTEFNTSVEKLVKSRGASLSST